MKKLYLIKNPELFQGKNYLKNNKNYFEGWYFKNTNNDKGVSLIPGININKNSKSAFIQVITNDKSYYVAYPITSFKFNSNPFYIKIGNNYFSKDKVHLEIVDDKQNLNIDGDLEYSNSKNINTNFLNPNIMGPFSYIPFMECNHAIISMKNNIYGSLNINEDKIEFDDGIGYIEKDWGISFPKTYIWLQGNTFSNSNVSFMCSIADIPFKLFNFRGFICVIIIDNKEYKFTTYNNSKIIKYEILNNSLHIRFKKKSYYLDIKAKYDTGQKLAAPIKGKMDRDIFESINGNIEVTLRKKDIVIFKGRSNNCGLEIV